MKKLISRAFAPVLSIFLLLLVMSTIAGASANRPRRGGGGGGYSVAEPAMVLLLGAGLVSLGIYAKRKRGKKQ
jgi:hypothetical protein